MRVPNFVYIIVGYGTGKDIYGGNYLKEFLFPKTANIAKP